MSDLISRSVQEVRQLIPILKETNLGWMNTRMDKHTDGQME